MPNPSTITATAISGTGGSLYSSHSFMAGNIQLGSSSSSSSSSTGNNMSNYSFTNYPSSGTDEGIIQDVTPPLPSGSVGSNLLNALKNLYNKFSNFLPITGGELNGDLIVDGELSVHGDVGIGGAFYSDGDNINSDGNGNLFALAIGTPGFSADINGNVFSTGSTQLDNGNIYTNGSGTLSATTLSTINFFTGNIQLQGGGYLSYGSVNLINTNGQINANYLTGQIPSNVYNSSVVTATTDLVINSSHNVILVNSQSNIVMYLPSAVGIVGRKYTIKSIQSVATVQATSSQTIDGLGTYSLSANHKYITVISDNSNWQIVANN